MLTPSTLSFNRPASWWGIRIYYLIFIGGFGFLWPFMSLFYARQGLTGTQIGLLGSISAMVGLLAAPLWGRWGDRAASPHRLLQFSFVASMILMLVVSQQTAFLWIAVLIALNEFVTAGSEPLSTVLALRPAARSPNSGFGSIRLWGSLGWAIIVFVSGWVIERTGIFSAFVGYGLAMTGSTLLLGYLFSQMDDEQGQSSRERPNTWLLLRQLLRNRLLLALAGALMVRWVTSLGIFQFEPLYMESLGAGESVIGLASTLGALIELPAMLLADHLTRKLGAWRLLQVNFGLNALMALGVLAWPSIPMILLTRLIGGVAFSLMTVSLVVYLNDNAPHGQSATMLALFTITLRGLVILLAAPIGGRIFDIFGAYWLYALAFSGSLVSLALISLTRFHKPLKGEYHV